MAGVADEVLVAPAASPDHKRKIRDLETETPEIIPAVEEGDREVDAASESPDSKRPRLEDNVEVSANGNGYQENKLCESVQGEAEQATATEETQKGMNELVTEKEPQIEVAEHQAKEIDEAADAQNILLSNGDGAAPPSALENSELDNAQVQSNEEETNQASNDATPQGNVSEQQQQQPYGDTETSSRKIEVPNNKVGVLIGKGGETIRYLQYNSGAKIQIVRDADANLDSPLRPVELVGSLESINKAEKLIKDVIAEAEAGGSPALIARGVAIAPVTGSTEQIEIKVPNDKVGLIIGKGGETIKSLQTKSGARIQLIPQHLPEGTESKERIVRVTGDKRQIDVAREMIKDAMRQQKPSNLSGGGYPQQPYRPRGPSGGPQWGPRPPYSGQPMAYDYQRGPYPGPQNSHYGPPPPSYNSYPQQQMPPRGGFGPGWDQRNPNPPPHQGGGYDFYGGSHGSHAPNSQIPGPHPGPGIGPQQPPVNYNYGSYPQSGPPPQGYSHGHGYEPPKYDTAPPAPQYSTSQPMYPQAGPQGYAQNYGKPPIPYGNPQQPQPYGNPNPNPNPNPRPDSGYSGYNQAMTSQPQQQPYPYPSTEPVHMQQPSYPVYGGSAPTADASSGGHGQGQGPPPPHQAPPQHHFQPAPGPVSGGYGSYQAPQQGYPEQQQQQSASQQDGGYGAAPGAAYGAAPSQPVYDQSGGYGAVTPSSVPQYDSTQQQVYGAPR